VLQKIRGVRQDETGRERHWFQDDFFDLFAWTDAAGEVVAFQLCYDRLKRERVLAWSEPNGFIHRRIDDGEDLPVQKMAPIMVAAGPFAADEIAAEFDRRSASINARWRQFIRTKIDEATAQFPMPHNPS
jgi:hypothetical protein